MAHLERSLNRTGLISVCEMKRKRGCTGWESVTATWVVRACSRNGSHYAALCGPRAKHQAHAVWQVCQRQCCNLVSSPSGCHWDQY